MESDSPCRNIGSNLHPIYIQSLDADWMQIRSNFSTWERLFWIVVQLYIYFSCQILDGFSKSVKIWNFEYKLFAVFQFSFSQTMLNCKIFLTTNNSILLGFIKVIVSVFELLPWLFTINFVTFSYYLICICLLNVF